MNTQFDIESVLVSGKLNNELDYERAMMADRNLRLLLKENPKLKPIRKRLRDIIEAYEDKNWSGSSKIDDLKIIESDLAEMIAENERLFLKKRKQLIRQRLKNLGLNQQDLMLLLGHKSKTYMSELVNGISPFTLNNLVVINRLLKISLTDLVPTTLSQSERDRINRSIQTLGTHKIRLEAENLNLVLANSKGI